MSREETIFDEARVRPAAERPAFLEQACAGDAALRARIEALLAGYAEMERALPTNFAPDASALRDEKPSDRIGRYKLLEKLGEGGCGVVWMAEQDEPVRRRVALKVIKLGMDTRELVGGAPVTRFSISQK